MTKKKISLKPSKVFLQKRTIGLIVGLAVVGAIIVGKIFAATTSLSLVASPSTVNIGATVSVAIRVNAGETINAVQANLAYESAKLQFIDVVETGSALPTVAETTATAGSLKLARATGGGAAPISGDNLVTTVRFKAIATGPTNITFASGSAVANSADSSNVLALQNPVTLNLVDSQAPTTPSSFTASSIGITNISFSWLPATDNVAVTGYRIYRNGTQVGTPSSTSYTDTNLAPNTTYSYTVAAVDGANNVSAQSGAISPKTLADSVAPSSPGKPSSATQTMTTVNLSWTAATDNVAVTGYRIYRNGTQVGTPSSTSYTDTNLAPNTTYSYTVAAVDGANNVSAQSGAASVKTLADTQPPTTPLGLSGSASGRNVNLSWTAATDNVAVTGYRIYQDNVQVATSTSTTSLISAVAVGAHSYTVAATDAVGNVSAKSAAVSVTVYQSNDINIDGKVDIFDLSAVLSNWGKTGANSSDVNKDNVVNIFDLSAILSNWTG